jgi:hypothetical protein
MLSGSWERAQDVVVGDVDNITALGSQHPVPQTEWGIFNQAKELYWCRADFHATAVIKGSLPAAGKRFLWADASPGCELTPHAYGYMGAEPPVTRIWFIREEGDYLRPAVDAGGVYFVSVHGKWSDPPKGEAARLFALLMLNEPAMGGVLSPDNLTLFTLVLGVDEAGQRLSALAAGTRDDQLRKWVCNYLRQTKYACH